MTGGPTWIPIDDVRIISNKSSGQLAHDIAHYLSRQGAKTTLLEGPVTDAFKSGAVRVIKFQFYAELSTLLRQELKKGYDIVIHAAAVSDYRLHRPLARKLKRTSHLTLRLEATPDIVGGLARRKGRRVVVGFALESDRLLARAKRKLEEKQLDLLVANRVNGTGHPFGERPVSVVLLDRRGNHSTLRSISKQTLARRLLDRIEKMAA